MVRKKYVYGTVFVNLVRVRVRVRVNMGFHGTGTDSVPVYAVRGMPSTHCLWTMFYEKKTKSMILLYDSTFPPFISGKKAAGAWENKYDINGNVIYSKDKY